MDPFTEKLLERTRARRENLQKKMAERPNAANRPMAKRPREPLTDTNAVTTESVTDKVPQVSSKPSPSKRRCSEETGPAAGEENQEPMVTQAGPPALPDPPTDKKPPVGPAPARHSSSLEKTAARPAAPPQPEQPKAARAEPENMAATPIMNPPSGQESQQVPTGSASQRSKAELESCPAPAGMRSRLQRLAEQRKCWDGTSESVSDCSALSSLRGPAEVQPPPKPTDPSETALGRKGRLANLAATIGSWEDDLSHAHVPREKPGAAPAPKFGVKQSAAGAKPSPAGSSTNGKSRFDQEAVHSPVKSSGATCPQKASVPASKLTPQSVHSPQKSSSQGAAFQSSPQKPGLASSSSATSSPLKKSTTSAGPSHVSSPQKPALHEKPAVSGSFAHSEKSTAGPPVVKSFLERFGERCQQYNNQKTPTRVATPSKPSVSVTPNTKLVQERLQAASTATADLTQRQKQEREAELAQIRNRFQKGNNVWKNRDEDERAGTKTETHSKEQRDKPLECEAASDKPKDVEATAPPSTRAVTPTKSTPPDPGSMASPPASASSPRSPVGLLKPSEETPEEKEEEREVIREREMNVDESINSAVINELFDEALEQSEDEDEEEDALNISSMSILAPLAETVAAVGSPDRSIMTSTPATSFIVKNDDVSKRSKFQRTNMKRTSSTDSVRTSDEEPRLPYSIDAYRSTRVKDAEKPNVKQVIVRKEDVSVRPEEPRGSSLFSLKQKIKILTNEVNLQQTVIHQASQALNCCTDEEHGKGSQVEAEAERLLLVATKKREALKAELDRLKVDPEKGQKKAPAAPELPNMAASKGSVCLQELRLPLKADFVCSTANKPESTKHSFFIMIRAGGENTVATPLASTHSGLSGDTLTFPTKFTQSDVSSNFQIGLDVYCLVQKREVCSDKKKKPNKSKAITPKRFLAISKSAQTPVLASPGGPSAVRTSNFVLVGSHTLSLSSIGKNKFALEKVPFLCPLEGHVYLKMHCEVGSKVEERGFLTMFEDVSGFGAWHRRWCVLSGYCVSYWTYPDDERRKSPIGRINLANCTSKTVAPANREFCARPNTFELITVRPQREDDRETLVSQCQNTMCVTKNWLSADTKEERNLWMGKLNQILVDLRMWQPDGCFRPV